MDKTLQEKIDLSLKVTQTMISKIEVKLQDAIKNEKWGYAAELESYLNGMRQIQIVFGMDAFTSGTK